MAVYYKTDAKQIFYGVNEKENYPSESTNQDLNTSYITQHFIHPKYILFDWEFFSNELEFE